MSMDTISDSKKKELPILTNIRKLIVLITKSESITNCNMAATFLLYTVCGLNVAQGTESDIKTVQST
jgi:hypothetical protein